MLIVSTGSTASHNSSRKDGSAASIHQKTRKEMIMEKLREQLYKAKAFIMKRYDEVQSTPNSFLHGSLSIEKYSGIIMDKAHQ